MFIIVVVKFVIMTKLAEMTRIFFMILVTNSGRFSAYQISSQLV